MLHAVRTRFTRTAAAAVAIALAVVFTGSVLGAEGRLPQRLMPEAVSLAVTTPVSALPAQRRHR
jgi:hypothetical protein